VQYTNGDSDTNFTNAINTLAGNLPTAGLGSSTATARQFVFILTDGAEDAVGHLTSVQSGRTVTTMDPSVCTNLKSKGATVSVIWAQYLPFPQEQSYNWWIAPIANQIEPALQSCATSLQTYAKGSDAASIQSALTTMFSLALSTPAHFTQ
jgi:hypothetical protein